MSFIDSSAKRLSSILSSIKGYFNRNTIYGKVVDVSLDKFI